MINLIQKKTPVSVGHNNWAHKSPGFVQPGCRKRCWTSCTQSSFNWVSIEFGQPQVHVPYLAVAWRTSSLDTSYRTACQLDFLPFIAHSLAVIQTIRETWIPDIEGTTLDLRRKEWVRIETSENEAESEVDEVPGHSEKLKEGAFIVENEFVLVTDSD